MNNRIHSPFRPSTLEPSQYNTLIYLGFIESEYFPDTKVIVSYDPFTDTLYTGRMRERNNELYPNNECPNGNTSI